MDTLDRTIRDLAAAAGHTNLTDKDVRQVKQALSNTFIDSVLDGTKMAARDTAPIGEEDTDEDIEDDAAEGEGDDDGDLMDDAESADATDDPAEETHKLKPTKRTESVQPNSTSSAITGYRPGISGMGQVG